jgi:hypothetical protein
MNIIPHQKAFPPLTNPHATVKVTNPLPVPEECPHCQGEVELVRNAQIYGRPFGDWPYAYACQDCDAYVGLHPQTLIPLGTLANRGLRHARKAAHQAFDPIWKERHMNRTTAYIWLAMQLKIDPNECHISWFDTERCIEVQVICENFLEGK